MTSPVRKAVILTADKFEDMEVFFPLYRLREIGWDVDIAAPAKKLIHGEHGYVFKPTLTIDEVNPDIYDLLLIPGGLSGRGSCNGPRAGKRPGDHENILPQEQTGRVNLPRTMDPCRRGCGEGQAPDFHLA